MCRGTKDEYSVRVLVAAREFRLGSREYEIEGVHIVEAPALGRFSSAPLCPTFPMLLKKYRADILHFHFPHPTGEISYLLKRPGGKVVVTYHSDIVRQKTALRLYRPLIYRFLAQADVILPTSPNYIEHSEFLREFKYCCEVMPLGIPMEAFECTATVEERARAIQQSSYLPIVLFVGVLRYYKGLEFLLRAMQTVNARLILVGAGPERARLEGLAHGLDITDRVEFAGEVSDAEKVYYLYAAGVFCLPSHLPSEAFGISQIEAMACGVPVVSTSLDTGVPFVNKDGETGLTVPPAQPRPLANAINRLLRDESERTRMGENARRRAHTLFSAETMTAHLKKVYRSVLQD